MCTRFVYGFFCFSISLIRKPQGLKPKRCFVTKANKVRNCTCFVFFGYFNCHIGDFLLFFLLHLLKHTRLIYTAKNINNKRRHNKKDYNYYVFIFHINIFSKILINFFCYIVNIYGQKLLFIVFCSLPLNYLGLFK